jgi:hypothetical protein
MFNKIVIALLLTALAACAAPRRQPHAPEPSRQPAAALQSLPAAGEYPIDADSSELRLLVYRAGPLANLGHNHVMVNRAVSGRVQIGASLPASSFTLRAPADGFNIDDAQSRREEGADFAGEIPDDAKAGTRRNMLSGAVLDAAEFPDIAVKSVALTGTLDAPGAELEISVAGHRSRLSVPFTLQGDSRHFIVLGTVELRQSALGIVPYSLLHGALQVQDAMLLKFKFTVSTD